MIHHHHSRIDKTPMKLRHLFWEEKCSKKKLLDKMYSETIHFIILNLSWYTDFGILERYQDILFNVFTHLCITNLTIDKQNGPNSFKKIHFRINFRRVISHFSSEKLHAIYLIGVVLSYTDFSSDRLSSWDRISLSLYFLFFSSLILGSFFVRNKNRTTLKCNQLENCVHSHGSSQSQCYI